MKPEEKRLNIQNALAIASFASGVIIACINMWLIEPLGQIHSSAISIVSELLVLCGSLLGISANFDLKMKKFKADIIRQRDLEAREVNEDEED